MRRAALTVVILMLALLGLTAPAASAAHVRSGHYAWTTADVNLRTGPSTSYRILRILARGSRLSVTSAVSGTHWYRVAYGSSTGYVSGNYLAGASSYAYPVRPAASTSYGSCHHDYSATDIFAPTGSSFVAVTGGKVDSVERTDRWDPATDNPADRGGISVAIIGQDGVRYYGSHLSAIATGITVGTSVTTGQLLGSTGRSGNARYTEPHLHFGISHPTTPDDWAVRRGEVSPYSYLGAWRNGRLATPDLTRTGTGIC